MQWHHNWCDRVSNHQTHDRFPNRLFRRRSEKTSKLRVPGLCACNSPVTGEFPAQMASNAKNVSIWWRHHDSGPWWIWYFEWSVLSTYSMVVSFVTTHLKWICATVSQKDFNSTRYTWFNFQIFKPYCDINRPYSIELSSHIAWSCLISVIREKVAARETYCHASQVKSRIGQIYQSLAEPCLIYCTWLCGYAGSNFGYLAVYAEYWLGNLLFQNRKYQSAYCWHVDWLNINIVICPTPNISWCISFLTWLYTVGWSVMRCTYFIFCDETTTAKIYFRFSIYLSILDFIKIRYQMYHRVVCTHECLSQMERNVS